MCGIIGIIGRRDVCPLLVEGLKRLEYRGYDSAGIASIVHGDIDRRRAEGKLENLAKLVERRPLEGRIGIGHTRWATHGAPNETKERKSVVSGKSVSVRVDRGGRRSIKKKKKHK